MNQGSNANRRNFERITLNRPVNLTCDNRVQPARLADISLRGMLLTSFDDHRLALGQRVAVAVMLDEKADCRIDMQGEVAHLAARRVGVHTLEMDLHSSEKLRRLIEVNLGDCALLERDLEAMLGDASQKPV
jgi:hypothetical protein